MTNILVYDVEAEKIEKIAQENDYTAADVIEALLDIIENEEIDINEWITGG